MDYCHKCSNGFCDICKIHECSKSFLDSAAERAALFDTDTPQSSTQEQAPAGGRLQLLQRRRDKVLQQQRAHVSELSEDQMLERKRQADLNADLLMQV